MFRIEQLGREVEGCEAKGVLRQMGLNPRAERDEWKSQIVAQNAVVAFDARRSGLGKYLATYQDKSGE
jgi:hypothetical protein